MALLTKMRRLLTEDVSGLSGKQSECVLFSFEKALGAYVRSSGSALGEITPSLLDEINKESRAEEGAVVWE